MLTREQLEEQRKIDKFVNWEDSPFVACDEFCYALREPETFEEYKAAHEHWKNHGYLCGCSHGC